MGSIGSDGSFGFHALPSTIAWATIAILCFTHTIPLSNSRSQQNNGFLDRTTTQVPRWLRDKSLGAAIIIFFYGLVSLNGRTSLWVLSTVSIAIFYTPRANSRLDCSFPNADHLLSIWRNRSKTRTLTDLKPVIWLATCLVPIVISLFGGCTLEELGVGLLFVLTGLAAYNVSGSILDNDYSSASEMQQKLLLPIALQACLAFAMGYAFFGVWGFEIHSAAFTAAVSVVQAMAILLSLIEGIALPVLAILSAITLFQLTVSTSSWPLLPVAMLAVCFVAQLLLSIPKSNEKQRNLGLYIIAPLIGISLLQVVYDGVLPFSFTGSVHPIQILHEKNLVEFQHKVSTQSRTAAQATSEYQRRYGRMPPQNFDKWFEIAKANSFQLPDEFDTIMTSISPYWGLPLDSLKQRIKAAAQDLGILTVSMRHSNASTNREHYHGPILTSWINKYTKHNLFPDFDFVINIYDEPRVNAPFRDVEAARSHSSRLTKPEDDNNPSWFPLSQKNIKDDLSVSCPPDLEHTPLTEQSLPFISDLTKSKDFCYNPSFFSNHGFFQAPETLIITRTLVPILSQCKPDRFNDILYPSPYYTYLEEAEHKKRTADLDWAYKHDSLYWSGSSTGGHSKVDNWRTLHRQHLSLLTTNDASTSRLQLLSSTAQAYNTTWSSVKSLMNIRLNRLVQCDAPACNQMKAAFPLVGTSDPVAMSVASKYALDMDGNTFSGRFYRLLRSKSCVLKMTAFKEWHDSFLVPWVHYIPVSSGFEELGEIMRYVSSDARGKKVGRRVADMGREWAGKVLRREDLEIVTLRVLMEVARLVEGEDRGEG